MKPTWIIFDELGLDWSNNKYAESLEAKDGDFVFVKPQTFMNESGSFVKKLASGYRLASSDLFVVHDDLDIPLGSYKIQFGKGPKDHKGLASIDQALGSDQYWHVRIGIDNRSSDSRTSGEDYVLQDFTDEERKVLENTFNKLIPELVRKLNTNF